MRERVTPERAFAQGRGAAVAAEAPEAGRAAAQLLERGGNAVDAAVALGFAACVVQPGATTVAGSGLLLVHTPTDGVWSVEFPPRAPLAARADMYAIDGDGESGRIMGLAQVVGDANDVGPLAVGVPGVVAGLCEAHRRFGRLALREVVAPAVALAADGFLSHPELQLATLANVPALRRDAELSALLLDEHGVPRTGDFGFTRGDTPPVRIVQPQLAELLERIGEGGAEAFYAGELAAKLIATLRERGAILSHDDLLDVRVDVRRPRAVAVGDHVLHLPHAPSGAWTAAQLLRSWEAAATPDPLLAVHRRVELTRHAFADRYHLHGDPDFADVPLELLLSEEHAARLAAAVDDERVLLRFDDGPMQPWNRFARERPHELPGHGGGPEAVASMPAGQGDSAETTHFSVADAEGGLVTCTTTAANGFGARVMCHGVLLDDAMIWFNARSGYPNSIAPGKRPLVNMSPLIAERADGATLALGAPGGRRVTCAVTQVARSWLDGESLDDALAAPRFDASGREVLLSARADPAVREALLERGHPVALVEDRDPLSYDFARPVGVARERDGEVAAGVHPFCRGFSAAS